MAKKVIMLPTQPGGDGRQHIRCEICGAETSYEQPIEFGRALSILKDFMDAHTHPEPPAPYCNGQCGICSCISSPQPQASPAK